MRKSLASRLPKDLGTILLFLLPYFALLFVFKILPIFINFFYSLRNMNLVTSGTYVGFKNYANLWNDKLFWTSIRNTMMYLLYVGPVNIIMGFFLALLLNAKLRGRIIVRTAVFMPYVMMITLVGITWRWILDGNNGILNYYLGKLGIPAIYWLSTEGTAMVGVAMTSIWWTIGYNMIIYLAALQDIPQELMESAQIDGANPLHRLLHITIPLVKGTTFYCVITTVIYSMQMFGQVYVMTGGGPNYSTLSAVQYLYIRGFREMKLGYAAAVGVILLLLILVLSGIVYVCFLDRDEMRLRAMGRKGRR